MYRLHQPFSQFPLSRFVTPPCDNIKKWPDHRQENHEDLPGSKGARGAISFTSQSSHRPAFCLRLFPAKSKAAEVYLMAKEKADSKRESGE